MKKKKIWSSIGRIVCALLIASSWIWFGVALALSNATIKIGGGIHFVANDVNAKIDVAITGSANADVEHTFSFDLKTTSETDSWNVPTVDFKDSATPIEVTLKVTNNHPEGRDLKVKVSATQPSLLTFAKSVGGSSVDNFTTTIVKGSSTATQASTQSASLNEEEGISMQSATNPYPFISSGNSQTFKIEMYYNATNKNITTANEFKIDIALMDQDYVENASDYSELSFTYRDSYASVSGNAGNDTKNIYIPSKIKKDGKVYEVDTIVSGAFSTNDLSSIYIPKTITTIYGNSSNGWGYENENTFLSLEYAYFEDPTTAWYCHHNNDYTDPSCIYINNPDNKNVSGETYVNLSNTSDAASCLSNVWGYSWTYFNQTAE